MSGYGRDGSRPPRHVSFAESLIRDKAGFLAWLDTACPHFAILQELANGSKHCSPDGPTPRSAATVWVPMALAPYGKPYLLIDKGDALPALIEGGLLPATCLNDVASFLECNSFSDNGPIP